MGQHDVDRTKDEGALRQFARQLIQDVRALEHMLNQGMFETDVRRIGAEQELFMVDEWWQPASVVQDVLDRNTDERVVSELTRFNLEFNLDPYVFGGDCLRHMEQQLDDMLDYVYELVSEFGARVVLTGILPTIHISDLTLENMTPADRYFALNDAINQLRGGPGQFQIRGVDELFVKHDSIMLEGCNTSFQTHFQVAPDEFARFYNIAQTVAAPVLAAAVNSPTLFGKRLWQETRIALFQQAIDTRSANLYLRDMFPRVHFGTGWVRESVTELFKEDISRFHVLLTARKPENPFDELDAGRVPALNALQLHNGTVYRWNRPCYGITDGKPHLRIENRILPAGPTTVDEVANAAFWFGLVSGMAERYDDIAAVMEFDDAKNNFGAAARHGLGAQLVWVDGTSHPAPDLILGELLPMAREGLAASDIDGADIERYLGIIEERVESRQTGARWMLDSISELKMEGGTRSERLNALVAATLTRQQEGDPVHTWSLAHLAEARTPSSVRQSRVEHIMTTDLFTVHEDESVEFVACLMDWQRLRHVLVEDYEHHLVGLISHRSVLRYLAEFGPTQEDEAGIPVRQIMVRDPISVSPETSAYEAIRLMRKHKIGTLPVVRDGRLVGIITERDFIHIAGHLIDVDDAGELSEAESGAQ